MEKKHRWRPATLPHGGQMQAACSRQATRFCYRYNSLQCRLGSHGLLNSDECGGNGNVRTGFSAPGAGGGR